MSIAQINISPTQRFLIVKDLLLAKENLPIKGIQAMKARSKFRKALGLNQIIEAFSLATPGKPFVNPDVLLQAASTFTIDEEIAKEFGTILSNSKEMDESLQILLFDLWENMTSLTDGPVLPTNSSDWPDPLTEDWVLPPNWKLPSSEPDTDQVKCNNCGFCFKPEFKV